MVNNKATGSFFTPIAFARSVVDYIFRFTGQSSLKRLSLLEPSAGDGVFLRALSESDEAIARIETIDIVDIEPSFVEECRKIELSGADVKYFCQDFLNFSGRTGGYDIILGNPPYISYKRLSKEQIVASRSYFEESGLKSSYFRNIWTLFLLKSSLFLNNTGIMAFVLPKDIIYVNHASWLRSLILNQFARVDVFVFDELHFDHADQDVAIIICHKQHDRGGLYISECCSNGLDFQGLRPIEVNSFYGSKWSQLKISDQGDELLRRCAASFRPLETYCTAVAGIVPAANSFFIVNSDQVKSLGIRKYVKPIIQKSNYIGRNLILSEALLTEILASDLPAYLLTGYNYDMPPPEVLSYLRYGEEQNLDKRYKMMQRHPWHRIPGIWPSEALFFKRVGEIPKFTLNTARALATDTAYRVTSRANVDLRSLIFSFYNSVTMVTAELRGRTYGGGVLELTPNEFKKLPVPFELVSENDFTRFVERMRSAPFPDVLAEQDDYLLPRAGISTSDIASIQQVRNDLYDKRLKKRKPKT